MKDVAAAEVGVRRRQPFEQTVEAVGGQVKGLVLRADHDAPARAEDAADLREIGVRPHEELDDVPQHDDVEEVVGEGQPLGLDALRCAERDLQPPPLRGLYGLS